MTLKSLKLAELQAQAVMAFKVRQYLEMEMEAISSMPRR